jgi:hypothetical protein
VVELFDIELLWLLQLQLQLHKLPFDKFDFDHQLQWLIRRHIPQGVNREWRIS